MLVASIGWWLGFILFIFIWIALAFWPVRVAARKGHSFFLYLQQLPAVGSRVLSEPTRSRFIRVKPLGRG